MNWKDLPIIRTDSLLFLDTSGFPLPGTVVPCLICEKPYLMRNYLGVPDQLCPECWKIYDGAARVICSKCNITICRVVPKVLECGYYVRPRSVLHVDACNCCRPGIKESKILEIDSWMRNIRGKKIILTPGSTIKGR